MTRTARAAALALSMVMTLAIFSGVEQLATSSRADATLSHLQTSSPVPRG